MRLHHQARRTRGTFLTTLLTAALAVTGTTAGPVHASTTGPGDRAGIYLVKLSEAPVTTYRGGLDGLKRTAPSDGERLDPASRAAKQYLRHLDTRRDTVLRAVPGVRKLRDYAYAFNGFAAKLTSRQAAELAATPGVVSVTPDVVHRLPRAAEPHAGLAGAAGDIRPPDTPRFLGLSGKSGLWAKAGGAQHAGEGMIVGVVDTGFDPTNPMLTALPEPRPDADVIARKWHGTCDQGDAADPAHRITCNNKVIGARWFSTDPRDEAEGEVHSPLDTWGHGTHTATTAAGNHDVPVSIPRFRLNGTVSGIAPAARLAIYKACWDGGCADSNTVAAIDQAVADGVDVINFSIYGTLDSPTSTEAMSNAAKAGVFVSAISANDGPGTVNNTAPWITTVAAESHDTGYASTLVLGDGRRFTDIRLQRELPAAPLVAAAAVRRPDADTDWAARCAPGTLDPDRTAGKIVVCDRGGADQDIDQQVQEVADAGGRAVALSGAVDSHQDVATDPDYFAVPLVRLTSEEGKAVQEYASSSGATAQLTVADTRVRAPVVIDSSSSGPDPYSGGDLLKPDLAAPGFEVLAGYLYPDRPDRFAFLQGTSIAAPHVAGLAALVKQLHPDWSPMAVKSALMTTATATDNEGRPIGRQGAASATPLDHGAGSPRAALAADPGLVYDSGSADWTAYLCAVGVKPTTGDGSDACATARRIDPSDLNYPSIAVGDLAHHQTVTRRVTNVGGATATYRATLQSPPGYRAKVTPNRLTLKPGASAAYTVTFTRTTAAYGTWSFGSLTWTDTPGGHRVGSPIALRATHFSHPAEITVDGRNSATLTTRGDWTGELTARSAGLYAAERTTGTTLTGIDQSDFASAPHTGDAVARIPLHVPEGTPFTRVAITSADHLPGSDLDLYVFDADGRLVSGAITPGSDESADVPPGNYTVYVVQFDLPQGASSQRYTLLTWKVGQGTPAARTSLTPAAQPVAAGRPGTVAVSWPDIVSRDPLVGAVEFGDGSASVGRTTLTARP